MTLAADWQARVGDVWAAEWRRTDRSFADLSPRLDAAIAAVAPEEGRAVDLGCGAGGTSLALAAAARPGLAITGIDLSAALIAVAAERGAGVANLAFATGSIPEALAPLPAFYLAFSRHGVMFFDDPAGAFAGIAAALAPGAALVFSCFRAPSENPWASDVATIVGGRLDAPAGYAPGPFAFADRGFVTALLATAGFVDIAADPVDFVYRAGTGDDPVADAASYLSRIGPAARILAAASPGERPALTARLGALLERHCRDGTVDFPAAAWIWSATKPREPRA